MKPIKSLFVFALVVVPSIAAAQPYYGGPPPGAYTEPGGFHRRAGHLAWGFSIGIGGMHDSGTGISSCDNCNFNPAAGEVDFHIGGMVNSRLAILFEGQANLQTIHSDGLNGDTTLTQTAAMVALQYWLTPQLWIKGGLGFAHLSVDDTYVTNDIGSGGAIMGAIGFEIFSGRRFALDLQGRIIEGSYSGVDDQITSGTIGLGFNWF
jgi:hypothetical protein